MKSSSTFNGDYLKVCDSGHYITLHYITVILVSIVWGIFDIQRKFQELALLHLQVTGYHYTDKYFLSLYSRLVATDENKARKFFDF
jgi:hypothetical protein